MRGIVVQCGASGELCRVVIKGGGQATENNEQRIGRRALKDTNVGTGEAVCVDAQSGDAHCTHITVNELQQLHAPTSPYPARHVFPNQSPSPSNQQDAFDASRSRFCNFSNSVRVPCLTLLSSSVPLLVSTDFWAEGPDGPRFYVMLWYAVCTVRASIAIATRERGQSNLRPGFPYRETRGGEDKARGGDGIFQQM